MFLSGLMAQPPAANAGRIAPPIRINDTYIPYHAIRFLVRVSARALNVRSGMIAELRV
jgi:hypothetical protein